VPPGGIIGRLAQAACSIRHPLISEAHAMVSLRGRSLKLIALRGAMEIDGARPRELALEVGQRIRLAQGVEIVVEEVVLPTRVLALSGLGPTPAELPAPAASIQTRPTPRLEPGYDPAAPAHVWISAAQWLIRVGDAPPEIIWPGGRWTIDGVVVTAETVPLEAAAVAATVNPGRIYPPMTLAVCYDTTTIEVSHRPPVILSGQAARLLYELALFETPTPWRVVAGEIWSGEDDTQLLRWSWDKAIRKLRGQLTRAGLRADLVVSRRGVVSLGLFPGDSLTVR